MTNTVNASTLSRRSFLGATAVVGAALSAAGLTSLVPEVAMADEADGAPAGAEEYFYTS